MDSVHVLQLVLQLLRLPLQLLLLLVPLFLLQLLVTLLLLVSIHMHHELFACGCASIALSRVSVVTPLGVGMEACRCSYASVGNYCLIL